MSRGSLTWSHVTSFIMPSSMQYLTGMWRHWEWDVMCNEAITDHTRCCLMGLTSPAVRAEWSPATHLKLNVMIEWWVHYLLNRQKEHANVFEFKNWWPLKFVDLDSCRFSFSLTISETSMSNAILLVAFLMFAPHVEMLLEQIPITSPCRALRDPGDWTGLSWAELRGCWAPDNLITTICKLLQVPTFVNLFCQLAINCATKGCKYTKLTKNVITFSSHTQ